MVLVQVPPHKIGDGAPCFIIAEAGVNHNGSLDVALQLVDVAADAGADAVKFQTFRAESVIANSAPKADYQSKTTDVGESQLEMVKRLELKREYHHSLAERCAKRGIVFISTAFDEDSARFLSDEIHVPLLKIPSGEVTNAPLLLALARLGLPMIFSTGMSTSVDVETALGVLAFGLVGSRETPSSAAFCDAFISEEGKRALANKVVLLHCTSEYPAAFEETNLLAIDGMRASFGLPVGLSDHTSGIAIPIAAVALGAAVIEKHFTLDRRMSGPDHKASIEPDELKSMVMGIRAAQMALGQVLKMPTRAELVNRPVVRRSLVAARAIAKGDVFAEDNIAAKRPGTGMSPMRYWDLLGRKARRDYSADALISEGDEF